MLVLLVLGIMGYVTGRISETKGRSFWLWFVIGVLTSWVGVIVAFVLPPKQ